MAAEPRDELEDQPYLHLLGDVRTATGKAYVCYYLKRSKKIVVKSNGVFVDDGDPFVYKLSDNIREKRTFTGYTTTDGTSRTLYFEPIPTFPYFVKKYRGTRDDYDENDLKITSLRGTNPTGSNNGTITVVGKGTNTPIRYSLKNPKDIPLYSLPEVGEFTGLPAGIYVVYAIDSKGFTRSKSISLIEDYTGNFGVKWRMDFTDNLGQSKRVDILKFGYSDSVIPVLGADNPCTYKQAGSGGDIHTVNILPSQLNVSLLCTTADEFIDIAFSDEKSYLVKQYLYNGSTYDLEWQGYVDPYSYNDQLYQAPYYVNITAKDWLGDLKLKKFIRGDEIGEVVNENEVITGDTSQLEALKICLDKLKLNTGYRIACNIFSEGHSRANKTPLEQTYFDASIYNVEGDDVVKTCDVVVKDILDIYGAVLISMYGYWYIIRIEELKESSVSYKQFDQNLVLQNIGSWSPRIAFFRPGLAGSFRWAQSQNRVFTKIFRSLTLSLDLNLETDSLIPAFSVFNRIGKNGSASSVFGDDSFYDLEGFEGFDLVKKDEDLRTSLGSKVKGSLYNYHWRFALKITGNVSGDTKSYIKYDGRIKYEAGDVFNVNTNGNIDFKSFPKFIDPVSLPYYIQKWSLKIGKYWYSSRGVTVKENREDIFGDTYEYTYQNHWITKETINSSFVESDDGTFLMEKEIEARNVLLPVEESYSFRLYPISYSEADLRASKDAVLIVFLKNINATNLPLGTRRLGLVDIDLGTPEGRRLVKHHYYELQESTDENDGLYVIKAKTDSDYVSSGVVWRLVEHRKYWTTDTIQNYVWVEYEKLGFQYLPSGKEIEVESEKTYSINTNNSEKAVKTLGQFDLPDETFNGKEVIRNYLKLSDGSPTGSWLKTGDSLRKKIQEHLASWLVIGMKKCRVKLSASAKIENQMTPLKVLHDGDNGGRIYMPIGMSVNHKTNMVSGEVLEIWSGVPTVSGFDDGIDQNAVT